MRNYNFKSTALLAIVVIYLFLTAGIKEGQTLPPPVSAPLEVREGDFAMKLAVALQLGQPSSETKAESMLADSPCRADERKLRRTQEVG